MDRNKKLKTLSIRFPQDTYDKLFEIAEEEERTVAQIIRLSIRNYLKEKEDV